jgi:hypothetical protein
MLFNKDYLFLHIPRTAGKCVKSSVIPFLEKPIFICQKQLNGEFFDKNNFTELNPSLVHSSLEELNFLIQNNDKSYDDVKNQINERKDRFSKLIYKNQHLPDIKNIKNIIVCLRNPLQRLKSLYKFDFFQGKYTSDFESYTNSLKTKANGFLLSTDRYFVIDDKIPENVKFIKFGSLEEDLSKLLNVEKVNVAQKKHNEIRELSIEQEKKLFRVRNIENVISNINHWEKWSISNGLLNPITEKDFLI